MRIWDVSPGYLARQQLLGEHRELHGMFNIISGNGCGNGRGYARHPETLRWAGHLPALALRHRQLVAEMALRGYRHGSPLPEIPDVAAAVHWPERFIDAPHRQFELLRGKYADGRSGRIHLPTNTQQLWAQHKYSLMARDPALYRRLGPAVAHGRYRDDMEGLAMLLTEALRRAPPPGRLVNALQHMWGHLSDRGAERAGEPAPAAPAAMLAAIAREAGRQGDAYLLASTALSELAAWL